MPRVQKMAALVLLVAGIRRSAPFQQAYHRTYISVILETQV